MTKELWRIVVPVSLVLYVAGLWIHFITWPEFVFEPGLVARGSTLYRDVINHHAPFLTWLFAAIYRVVGVGDGVQFACMICIAAATIFLLAHGVRRATDSCAAASAAVLFFALASPALGWDGVWFDPVLGLLYVAAITQFTVHEPSNRRLFVTGLLLGTAMGVKQHALLVTVGVLLLLCRHPNLNGVRQKARALCATSAGIAVPMALMALTFVRQGALADAWYWLVTYNLAGPYKDMGGLAPDMDTVLLLAILFLPALLLICAALWHGLREDTPSSGSAVYSLNVCLISAILAAALAYPRFDCFHLAATLPLIARAVGLGYGLLSRSQHGGSFMMRNLKTGLMSFCALGLALFVFCEFSSYGTTRNVVNRGVAQSLDTGRSARLATARVIDAKLDLEDRLYVAGGPWFPILYLESGRKAVAPIYPAVSWFLNTERCRRALEGVVQDPSTAALVFENPGSRRGFLMYTGEAASLSAYDRVQLPPECGVIELWLRR